MGPAWSALIVAAVLLLALALFWRRASRRRCPLDGGVCCPHCVYDDEKGQGASKEQGRKAPSE